MMINNNFLFTVISKNQAIINEYFYSIYLNYNNNRYLNRI